MTGTAHQPATAVGTSRDFVDVISVDLDPPAEFVSGYRAGLTAEECQRADRFVTEELSRRFAVCRAVLRRLLGVRLNLPPAEIRLSSGANGKPMLDSSHHSRWEFNVSHSENAALIALAWQRGLGIDIEAIGRRVSRDELARRFFSADEQATYFSLPDTRRVASFYRIWTCKEAYLKATGWGLSFPLGHFSVAADPDRPPGLTHVVDRPDEPARWSFIALPAGSDFAAALAVEGHAWTLRRFVWDHCAGVAISSDRG